MWQETALTLWKGTKSAFGRFEFGTKPHNLLLQFKYNIHVFAAFKNHHNTAAIASLLLDEEGNKKPYQKFEKEALAISKNTNKNHLRTEHNAATRKGRTAHNLEKALEEADLYPNWVYIPSKAKDKREDHKKYYNKVFSLTTPEGQSVLPPNGHNCQCGWRSTDEEVTDPNPDTSDIHEEFIENPQATGRVFSQFHPYYEVQTEFNEWAAQNWNLDLPASPNKLTNIFKEWQRVGRSEDYTVKYKSKDTGGFVVSHKDHSKAQLSRELKTAERLASQNSDAVVLEETRQGVKNADALVSGEPTEFGHVGSKANLTNTINRHTASARAKGATQVVITLPQLVNFENLSKGIRRAFENDSSGKIKTMIFIHKTKLVSITREAWEKHSVEHWVQKKLKD